MSSRTRGGAAGSAGEVPALRRSLWAVIGLLSVLGAAGCRESTGLGPGEAWQSLAAGYEFTCGLTRSGAVYCWGEGLGGQLGDSSFTSSAAPVAVAGRITFARLAAGWYHACGVTGSGVAYCWGGNGFGQLGDGDSSIKSFPVAVAGGLRFVSVTAGMGHSCGLTNGGVTYCWGDNTYGQLGDGTTTWRGSPVEVAGGLRFVSVSAGDYHTCGVTPEGAGYCWGRSDAGQLGDSSTDSTIPRTSPVAVAGGHAFLSVAAGLRYTCGVTSGGSAYCWGYDWEGQLGDSADFTWSRRPVAVAGGISFSSVVVDSWHTCGLGRSGAAYCWGENVAGELGDSSTTRALTPVAVSGDLAFTSLTAGSSHTCGATSGGAAYCWGANPLGQLGDGVMGPYVVPVPVAVMRP